MDAGSRNRPRPQTKRQVQEKHGFSQGQKGYLEAQCLECGCHTATAGVRTITATIKLPLGTDASEIQRQKDEVLEKLKKKLSMLEVTASTYRNPGKEVIQFELKSK